MTEEEEKKHANTHEEEEEEKQQSLDLQRWDKNKLKEKRKEAHFNS